MTDTTFVLECLLKRQPSTTVTMPSGNSYEFKPRDLYGDKHVAMVSHPEDVASFLQIREGYKLLGAVPPVVGLGAASEMISVSEVAETAPPSDASTEEPQPMPEALPPSHPYPEPFPMPEAAPGEAEQQSKPPSDASTETSQPAADRPLVELSDEELRVVFEQETGKPARSNQKAVTMIATIEAFREEKAKS